MGLTALAPTPAKPAPAKAPSAARPPAYVIPPRRTLAPPTCDCGSAAGFSGRCPACDRVSLRPRQAGVPAPPKRAEVASERPHGRPPKPGPDFGTLGVASAVAPKPVAVRQVSPVHVQTQMRVSSPSDPAEQEATSVGKTIMRMPNPDESHAPPPISHASSGVAQRDAAPGGHRHADPHIVESLRANASSGSQLPHDMRTFMEPRFRADFSGVRLHTDDHAAKLAAQLGARAFTIGRDIYFAKGEFRPDKPEGWELVAHELTHTLQQGGAAHAPVAPPKAPPPPAKLAAPAAQPAKAPASAPAAGAAAGGAAKPAAAGAATHGPAAAAPKPAAPPKPPSPKPAAAAAKPAPPKPAVAPPPSARDKRAAGPAVGPAAPAHAAPVAAKPAAAPAPAPRVAQRASPSIQRLGVSDVLDWIVDHANAVPGFRMLTIILGVNPINMSPVERSAANVMRAIIEFLPGGALITQALDNAGVFDKVGAWVSDQLSSLAMSGAALKQALMDFLNSLSWTDIFHPGDVWDRAKRIFTEPIDRIIAFVKGLVTGILKLIKDAILLPLAKLAEGARGWDLLIAVLGKNPITGDPVERSAENLIGGFLKLIGQEEVWENMKKANAIQRAWAWFQSAMSALMGFVTQIPDLFKAAFLSLTIEDVVLVVGAFKKVASVFGGFLANFISWAGNALWDLLKIIFDVVSPGALQYVMKTGAALKAILKDPLPFVKNLIAAAKLGLSNFASHFGAHLKQSLIDWLTGSLQGIYIPQALTLVEFGKFALSVLGISWAQIRAKIVKALGPKGEIIMKAMETGFDIVVALVKGGVGAAWELIKEKLTNLKDMVVDGIIGFVTDAIIQKAIPKLISLFIPGAGFISAILSIYDTIKVFIEKLSKIVAVVKAFVDSIVAIAAGQIAGAAGRVESALGDVLTLVISFLANFLGLTGITEKIMGVVKKVQATVDKALDTAINFVVGKAKDFIAKLFGKGKDDKKDGAAGEADTNFAVGKEQHEIKLTIQPGQSKLMMSSALVDGFSEHLLRIKTKWTQLLDKSKAPSFAADIDALSADGQKLIIAANAVATASAQSMAMNKAVDGLAARLVAICAKYGIPKVELGNYKQPPPHSPSYGGADGYGRATSMGSTLSFNTRPFMRSTSPSVTVPGTAIAGYQRGHLLAASLGGSNSAAGNFSPMSAATNTSRGGIENFEQALRKALAQDVFPPWIVDYGIQPQFRGGESELESSVGSLMGTPQPGAGAALFNLAKSNTKLTTGNLAPILKGATPDQVQRNLPQINNLLLMNFTPRSFGVTVNVEQSPDDAQPLPAAQAFSNHL
jgi:hypothetical protein